MRTVLSTSRGAQRSDRPRRIDARDDGSSVAGGVRVEIEAGVAVVTIDRPDVRNAIGFATIDELGAALDDVLESSAAVLVLRGGGRPGVRVRW